MASLVVQNPVQLSDHHAVIVDEHQAEAAAPVDGDVFEVLDRPPLKKGAAHRRLRSLLARALPNPQQACRVKVVGARCNDGTQQMLVLCKSQAAPMTGELPLAQVIHEHKPLARLAHLQASCWRTLCLRSARPHYRCSSRYTRTTSMVRSLSALPPADAT